MSIALERNNSGGHQIERLRGMACMAAIYNSAEFSIGDRRSAAEVEEDEDRSSSSSSIGRNSDDSPAGQSSSDSEGEEVQSSSKDGALGNLEDLEEVLPIKRGISNFYAGKSKSFTSLSDATSCSSLKDIVKPENPYTRKRKNELARNNFFDRNHNFINRSNSGSMYKRPTNARSSLALAATTCCSENHHSTESFNSTPSSPPCFNLPPLPPHPRRSSNEPSLPHPEQKFPSWRSFSLSDLQGAATAATPGIAGIKN
ncbi:PREDICTED: trinucleotide repeat-containing gene 18 protein-like [Ipomoea nil]|uniref:trinucleotide repeat-containing gene 18 protein-like n=1 Tax=Ipomoea nil TaxID=35883 RepID=UPI000900DB3E|nr:PREDICTED: trinucleotide repeat-containing gene 18 protein-like [Ipomoea nil]